MAYEGMLVNAGVTTFASACFLYVGFAVRRRRAPAGARSTAAMILFVTIGIHLAFAALRQLVAFVGVDSPAIARFEVPIFYASVIPAGLTIVPLAYIATWALTGREQVSRIVTGAFLAAVATGMMFVFREGIEGPLLSFWASEWTIVSLTARIMIILVMTIPAFIAAAILLHAGAARLNAPARRARLVGWACLLYYAAFTFDALGEPGIWLLVERLAMAVAAVIGWRAYQPDEARTIERTADEVQV